MNVSILLGLVFVIIAPLPPAFADQVVYQSDNRLKGKLFTFAVMESHLQKIPKWESSAEYPPLSPRKAVTVAKQKAKELLPEVYNWEPGQVTLVRAGPEGNWIYIVKVSERPNLLRWNNPPWINIIVLMDGAAVDPTVVTVKNDTHTTVEIVPSCN